MAPGTSVGINYEQQIKSNCRFYLGDGVDLRIITNLDSAESSRWKAHVLENDHGEQACILSAEGHTAPEAYTNLHAASARAVQRYIKANGFRDAELVGGKKLWKKKSKSRRAKTSPALSDFLESSSSSDGEDNMSDGSASTTSSRSVRSTTKFPGAIFTPPTSTDSTIPLPNRIVTHQHSLPVMNPVPPPNVVPPPGWHPRTMPMPMRHPAPPRPPPMAHPVQRQPPLIRPPPLCYPNTMVYPVLFTLKSKAYGELVVLDKCALEYAIVLMRVSDILAERFHEFSSPPPDMPSKNKISKMFMQIESVSVNGKKYVIGNKMCDLSALPLGLAPKGLNIVVSIEKSQFIED